MTSSARSTSAATNPVLRIDAVLLDTDVFSYLLKGNDPRAEPYLQHVRNKTVAISFVTVGELLYGAQKRGWAEAKKAELQIRLRSVVIVPFDLLVCEEYARLSCLKTAEGSDRTIDANDRWIAACAIRHGLPLVTNNRRHFADIPGLTIISEAPAPRRPVEVPLPLAPEPPPTA
jgi:predicted nucleic acid-binding protein